MNQTNYNPDVLSCLANLSSDEVFTPPGLVNHVLDLLPGELWKNPKAKFLDPVCKTGIFLREIAKRLNKGLEKQIPDQQKRINHIVRDQLYGIAITELTALLSRRSVYCSKTANGKYSASTAFDDEQGNIQYSLIRHTWKNGRCTYCGANKEVYDRGETLETHAYNFIHTKKTEKIFNMKFDVIVGNPPYQLSDAGAQKSASPIYHLFIEQAKKLKPHHLAMIIPARWYNGGKGLDEFRKSMLNDKRIAELHDFPDTSDCFPGLNIRGGICYFLWDKDHKGDCKIVTHKGGKFGEAVIRPLLERGLDVFIRYNEAINILKKVQALNEKSFSNIVSARKPFGLATNFSEYAKSKDEKHNILLYRFGKSGFISKSQIEKNHSYIDSWKVIVPYSSPGDDSYPHLILSTPIVCGEKTACTETYLVVGPFATEKIAKNVANYMSTVFFRFMILLAKSTQHITQKNYKFVPLKNFNENWTDEKLFSIYKINNEEIEFMKTLIKPMETNHE
jgi:site-specific DNA-methyltransferase (adenine-specific)